MQSIDSGNNFIGSESQQQLTDAGIALKDDELISSQLQQLDSAAKEPNSFEKGSSNQNNSAALRKKAKKPRKLQSYRQKRNASLSNSSKTQSIRESRIVSDKDQINTDRKALVENHVEIPIKTEANAQEPLQTNPIVTEQIEPQPKENDLAVPGNNESKEKKKKSISLCKVLIICLCCPFWLIYLLLKKLCKKKDENDDAEDAEKRQEMYRFGCLVCICLPVQCINKIFATTK